jgi:hypothetical protein
MAAVHAIEVADRQRDGAVSRIRKIPLYTQCEARGGDASASRYGIPVSENRLF